MERNQTLMKNNALKNIDFLVWQVERGQWSQHKKDVQHILSSRPRQRPEMQE